MEVIEKQVKANQGAEVMRKELMKRDGKRQEEIRIIRRKTEKLKRGDGRGEEGEKVESTKDRIPRK